MSNRSNEMENNQKQVPLPPGQQLVAPGKWPVIGEREPADRSTLDTLAIGGLVDTPRSFQLSDLRDLQQTSMTIDIHCVTRWSKLGASFSGILLEDLLAQFNVDPKAKFISFVSNSPTNHSSSLLLETAIEQKTLIALDYDGQPLEIGHGGPIRNIVPGRYFYKSVKWLKEIKLLEQDELGNWEAGSGYHNEADPWLEQRYMVPNLDRRTVIELIASRDFSNRDLRSIDASKRDLRGLKAVDAKLRDSNFNEANLEEADFTKANLSNAHLVNANLRKANFRNGDLEGTDFSGADLRGADFTNSSLIGASFCTFKNDQNIAAVFDAQTVLPDSVIAPLFPEQYQFVRRALDACK